MTRLEYARRSLRQALTFPRESAALEPHSEQSREEVGRLIVDLVAAQAEAGAAIYSQNVHRAELRDARAKRAKRGGGLSPPVEKVAPVYVTAYLARRLKALQVMMSSEPVALTRLPVRIESTANASRGESRGAAFAKRARVLKLQRAGALAYRTSRAALVRLPCVVRMLRLGGRPLDDDNLEAAFKAFRDGWAKAAGVDDADERITYVADQRPGGAYAVQVEVFAL